MFNAEAAEKGYFSQGFNAEIAEHAEKEYFLISAISAVSALKQSMKKTFEASLTELEKIVEQLENGDITLEESLKLFETGVKLSRECRERLTDAERRIEVLMKDGDGNLNLSEFSADAADGAPQPVKRIVFRDD